MASSNGWTPLFLNADPQSTGTTCAIDRSAPAAPPSCDRWGVPYRRRTVSPAARRLARRSPRRVLAATSSPGRAARLRRFRSHRRAQIVAVDDLLHRKQVDDALELILGADRDLESARRVPPRRSRILSTTLKKSAPIRSILLTKMMRGTSVFVGLAPDGFGLRLHRLADGIEERDQPIEHLSERSTSTVKST